VKIKTNYINNLFKFLMSFIFIDYRVHRELLSLSFTLYFLSFVFSLQKVKVDPGRENIQNLSGAFQNCKGTF